MHDIKSTCGGYYSPGANKKGSGAGRGKGEGQGKNRDSRGRAPGQSPNAPDESSWNETLQADDSNQ